MHSTSLQSGKRLHQTDSKDECRQANEHDHFLQEQALFGTYVIQDNRFCAINEVAASYINFTPEEILNKETEFLLHPDDIMQVKKNTLLMLKSNRRHPQEFRVIKKNGEICWLKGIVQSTTHEGRRAILGSVIDITAQKDAEEALQESRRKFVDLIEFLPDATFAIDLEGKLIAWNRAAEELTDIKAKRILGKNGFEHARPFWKARRPVTIDLVLRSNRKYETTYNVFKRERNLAIVETFVPGIQVQGHNAYLWGKASPLYDTKGNVIGSIEVIRDITQHKRAEESLLSRERQLEIKSNELSELNTALKVLLNQREADKTELEERLISSVEQLVQPYLNELKKRPLDATTQSYISILEANLQNILSPFASKVSAQYLKLTNSEVRIAALINEGWSSKEIAGLLKVSPASINIYRYRIRKKLGLRKEENLRTFLAKMV